MISGRYLTARIIFVFLSYLLGKSVRINPSSISLGGNFDAHNELRLGSVFGFPVAPKPTCPSSTSVGASKRLTLGFG
jgi:hypothetical protein